MSLRGRYHFPYPELTLTEVHGAFAVKTHVLLDAVLVAGARVLCPGIVVAVRIIILEVEVGIPRPRVLRERVVHTKLGRLAKITWSIISIEVKLDPTPLSDSFRS